MEVKHAYERSGIVSKFFIAWLFPWMFHTARGRSPVACDLGPCPTALRCHVAGVKLDRYLRKQLSRKHPNLTIAIVQFLGIRFWLALVCLAFVGLLKGTLQPIILLYLFHPEKSPMSLVVLVTVFITSVLIRPSLNSISKFTLHYIATQASAGFTAVIYDKMLRLDRNGMSTTSVGQIMNIVANDLRRLNDAVYRICQVFSGIIDTAGAFTVLWLLMGPATSASLVVVLFAPVFGFMTIRLLKKARLQFSLVVDERSRLLNDVLGGVRVVKMYAWEKAFLKIIDLIRLRELKKLRLAFWITVINTSVFSVSGRLMTFLNIALVVFATSAEVTLDDIFLSLLIFNHLRVIAFIIVSEAIIYLADVGSVLVRLKEMLLLPEISDDVSFVQPSEDEEPGIEAVDIRRSWDSCSPEYSLSITSRKRELVVITGTVGSGKSSLLCALFGECPLTSGKVRVFGRIAYAPQDPWILARTVKENIIMDANFDLQKYNEVVEVCALKRDFEQLLDGENTLVGEKGSTLSGGQKARISLARALYSEADIYFLDSPFNAVDSKVFNHIFNNAILGYLGDKTVFLVASQINCYKMASRIIVMNKGQIMAMGPFEEIQQYLNIVDSDKDRGVDVDSAGAEKLAQRKSFTDAPDIPLKLDAISESSATLKSLSTWRIYYRYFSLGRNLPIFILLFLLCSGIEALFKFADLWITLWVPMSGYKFSSSSNTTVDLNSTISSTTALGNLAIISWAYSGSVHEDMFVYGMMLLGGFILCIVFGAGLCEAGERVGRTLHDTALKRVLNTSLSYYATNSEEKILNDFTRDTSIVDEEIPLLIIKIVKYSLELLGCICFGLIFRPALCIVVIFIFLAAKYLTKVYVLCTRSFRHIEADSLAPLFSHMGDTWRGLPVIRATHLQESFIAKFRIYLDHSSCATFTANSLPPWFSAYQELVGSAYIITLLAFFVADFLATGQTNVLGLLALITAVGFTGLYQHNILSMGEVDGKIISVDRILKYWDLVPEEPEVESTRYVFRSDGKRKKSLLGGPKINPCMVPDYGSLADVQKNDFNLIDKQPDFNKEMSATKESNAVVFENVFLAYDGNMALRNLSFCIRYGEKVGIVGRTGAGKSSLMTALFRLTPLHSGSVFINGMDAAFLPLADLRRSIAIIPQDPVLFAGTARMNLDPEDVFPDYQIWNVLQEVQLESAVKGLPGGLSAVLKSADLSVGQKQLFCLARALLGKKKILVMDEATANIDNKTEGIIQKALSNKFKTCSVMIIAHKIQSVLGCHRVMVLEKGQIIEFDAPTSLMKNEKGIFYSLLKHSDVRNPLENHL